MYDILDTVELAFEAGSVSRLGIFFVQTSYYFLGCECVMVRSTDKLKFVCIWYVEGNHACSGLERGVQGEW